MRYRQRLPIISIHSSAIFILLIALSSPQSGRRIESKTKQNYTIHAPDGKTLMVAGKRVDYKAITTRRFPCFLLQEKKNIFFFCRYGAISILRINFPVKEAKRKDNGAMPRKREKRKVTK